MQSPEWVPIANLSINTAAGVGVAVLGVMLRNLSNTIQEIRDDHGKRIERLEAVFIKPQPPEHHRTASAGR